MYLQAFNWSRDSNNDFDGLLFLHDCWGEFVKHTHVHLFTHFQEVWYVVPLLTCVYLQLSLSGILTVFFCGIVMSHYTWHNVTESSKITTRLVQKHSLRSNRFFMNIFKLFMAWLQAHIRNTVIHRWNLHIPLCWDGCSW